MKNIIIIFLFINCLSLYSQDFEPNQTSFRLGIYNNYYLSADSSYFKQNGFILGWAWGFGRKMSEAMLDNQAHVASLGYQKSMIKNNTNLIINTDNVWDNGGGSGAMNSQSLVYSPVLHITNPESQTNIRQNDPKHSIFGFNFSFLISEQVVISSGITLNSGIKYFNQINIHNYSGEKS